MRLNIAKSLVITAVFLTCKISVYSQKAELYNPLSEKIEVSNLCKQKADTLFELIRRSKAFDWTDEDNNCEDRANAVSLILDSCKIQNGKAWIFQGVTFDSKQYNGTLGGYSYHVACCILIKSVNAIDTLIIDPLMNSERLLAIREWAELIAVKPMNIYILTSNKYYQQGDVSPTPDWKIRDQYFEDTIDGLTRYNNFSWWTKFKTKKYLKKRPFVLREFNLLISATPKHLNNVNCN